ncbi:MAG: hypothetical protein QOK39_479, partial [Acidimicrobiaceae bacterium]|nr:hypothetical protein [Acidimicrobiaceae bacterium]
MPSCKHEVASIDRKRYFRTAASVSVDPNGSSCRGR